LPDAALPDAALAELRTLYVQRPFLRRGIGARLLAQVERDARTRGADVLWLTAWVGNTNALAFYASCGYAALGTTWHVFENERHENRLHARRLDGRVP
jgi:GNAT superfamily N-acetyltransferase